MKKLDLDDKGGNVIENKGRRLGKGRIQDSGFKSQERDFESAHQSDSGAELLCPFGQHVGREAGKELPSNFENARTTRECL
jgi:hypothetical protein